MPPVYNEGTTPTGQLGTTISVGSSVVSSGTIAPRVNNPVPASQPTVTSTGDLGLGNYTTASGVKVTTGTMGTTYDMPDGTTYVLGLDGTYKQTSGPNYQVTTGPTLKSIDVINEVDQIGYDKVSPESPEFVSQPVIKIGNDNYVQAWYTITDSGKKYPAPVQVSSSGGITVATSISPTFKDMPLGAKVEYMENLGGQGKGGIELALTTIWDDYKTYIIAGVLVLIVVLAVVL